MHLEHHVAIITGGAGGIGQATVAEMVKRGVKAIGIVDQSETVVDVAGRVNDEAGRIVAVAYQGDVTDETFRQQVFADMSANSQAPSICVPAAGITRDQLAVKLDKASGRASLYPSASFRQVIDVNLVAPIYWAMETIAAVAERRQHRKLGRWHPGEAIQGGIIFLGSVASVGNKGQLAYAAAKAGLEGAASTLMAEAMYYGVRCGVIHPGFTDTPMVRALGDDFIERNVLPQTRLGRLIRPEEIADAICFMLTNSAMSGELWADAGWRPAV